MKTRKLLFLLTLLGFVSLMFFSTNRKFDIFEVFKSIDQDRLVVIDPGHGGFDPGAVVDRIKESKINLEIAKKLKDYFEMFGFKVILTRYDDNDLSETDKKVNDLKKRREIVLQNKPELFISIHLNSFSIGKYYGAQVFYEKSNKEGEKLARFVQNELRNMPNGMFNKRQAKPIDIFVLRNLNIPAVLVECGFMSNKMELALLQKADYQDWLSYSILKGVLKYYQEREEEK